MPKKKPSRAKRLGNWSMAHGDLEFEARIFDTDGETGCEVAVIDVEEDIEVILAVGKKELGQVIAILQSAMAQVDLLPAELQVSPEEGEEGEEDEGEEELDDDEEEGEELDA
jgi:hypothetical protein